MKVIIKNHECTISKNNINIKDSYTIKKKEIIPFLEEIKSVDTLNSKVGERSMFSLKMEMIFHTFLYNIHYERERTRDVDLDNPCDKPEGVYKTLGILTWIFVK